MKPFLLFAIPAMALAQNYTAQKLTDHGVEVIRLTDAASGVEVSIAPSIGNRAYQMKVHGKDILYMPVPDVGQLKQRPGLSGVPFLAPWANRMADGGFWANGKKYTFNGGLGTVRLPPTNIAIHGMLSSSDAWQVTELVADSKSASVTSRLEFWKYPDLMANWPFAHEYEITYKLVNGTLEVITNVVNRGNEPMPLALGYHPYYVLPDVPRDEAVAHIPAKLAVVTDDNKVATGELKPMDLPDPTPLKDRTLDNGYTELIRDAQGKATFSVEGRGKKIEVVYGPKWIVAVVWEPANQPFICFEPMAGITNGVNLAHDGKYSQLQILAPGATWRESFWIRTSGI
ncbi:MAG TPA: aldose 1-epimerase [Bryobacteraceae bacterium]|nr:aldose 1-epimerase [Bryobacteraceae bacterium]